MCLFVCLFVFVCFFYMGIETHEPRTSLVRGRRVLRFLYVFFLFVVWFIVFLCVFVGLFVCVVCVLLVAAAVVVCRLFVALVFFQEMNFEMPM